MTTLLDQDQAAFLQTSGERVTPKELLGTGGQGEVWRAALDGRDVALKWYNRSNASPRQHELLETLIDRGAPNERFLWPEAVVKSEDVPGFGYVMQLRPERFVSATQLLNGQVDPSFGTLVRAAALLADSFLELHAKGLAYCDISYGNVFLAPDTGNILVCDNDNVVIDGSEEAGVAGTPAFMAPEIVCGEALPNSDTDRHSLATLLFYILMIGHPLEGERVHQVRCMDGPAREKFFGEEPVFIFDPNDASNRPVPGVHSPVEKYWSIYPNFIKRLFVQAFTTGLEAPSKRVRESQWRKAFGRLLTSLVRCDCGAGNFYDREAYRARGGTPGECWRCGRRLTLPPRMLLEGEKVVCLESGTDLYPHHIEGSRDCGLESPVGRVIEKDGRRGLKNLGESPWVVTGNDSSVTVPPDRAITLRDGFHIEFGARTGIVRIDR